jgi:hypothetical protein
MKTLELEQTSPDFRKMASQAQDDVLILTRKGKPAYAVVSIDDEFALEAFALSQNDDFMAYLDAIAARMDRSKPATLNEVRTKYKVAPPQQKSRQSRKA